MLILLAPETFFPASTLMQAGTCPHPLLPCPKRYPTHRTCPGLHEASLGPSCLFGPPHQLWSTTFLALKATTQSPTVLVAETYKVRPNSQGTLTTQWAGPSPLPPCRPL